MLMVGINSSAGTAPSVQSGENESHICPICLKQFGRKDLRDRHRRRCEKSIGKAKRVKKKACERCIASKVKCGYEKPSCSRCLSRSVACKYKLEPQIRMPADPALRLRITSAPSTSTTRLDTHGTDDDEMQGLLPSSMTDSSDVFSLAASHAPVTSGRPMPPDTDPSYLWTSHSTGHRHEDPWNYRIPTTGPDICVDNSSTLDLTLMTETSWMPDLLDSALFSNRNEKEDDLPDLSRPLEDHRSVSDILSQRRESRQQESGHLSIENSVSRTSSSSIRTSSEAGSPDGGVSVTPSQQSQISPPARAASADSSLTSPLLLSCRPKSIPEQSGSLSDLVQASLACRDPLQPGMISLGEAVKITAEYPLRMLATTFRSPFIHPRLNRQCPRGMPEPIAVALACVGMKLHSEQSGLPFVCDIFRDQRDRLIKELPSMSDNHEQLCASLHAMCIYQIEGLLSEKRYHSRLATAVLHHEYLVRATKRVIKQIRDSSPNSSESPSFLSCPIPYVVDWDTWAIQESLRRTIFLILIIHQLLGVTNTLDPAYFEPLLPEDVFESIELPSSDALWMAESEEEWLEARRGQGGDGVEEPLKLGEAVRRTADRQVSGCRAAGSVADAGDADSRDDNGSRDEDWSLEQFPELTRLIISVASVSIKEL